MISQKRIQELFDYDQETGYVINRVTRCPTALKGDRAGTVGVKGYRQVYLSGTIYYEHRLVWFYVHGYWPIQIDHINGDRSDNRLANLREVTQSQNNANSDRSKDASRLRGAYWIPERHKWRADIQIDGQTKYLGYFGTAEAAHSAYLAAAETIYGEHAYHNRPTSERTN